MGLDGNDVDVCGEGIELSGVGDVQPMRALNGAGREDIYICGGQVIPRA